jgi:N-acetylglutamate synthase/N-acetylornithine aminotransferase
VLGVVCKRQCASDSVPVSREQEQCAESSVAAAVCASGSARHLGGPVGESLTERVTRAEERADDALRD